MGRRVAQLLAAEGAWIAINHFADPHRAKALLDDIRSAGGRAMLAAGSARDAEGVWKITRYVEYEWAQIDVLVHAAALLTGDESVPDPGALLNELLPGMMDRRWGRVVLFEPVDTPLAVAMPPVASNVLINRIRLSSPIDLSEAAARLTVFLASEWNLAVTDGMFRIGDGM
ncbi:MAG: SDR family oxidoreductase [Anaerolineae bacterium]|nr:SDR family oxidoreductase [Anaerolineae bacterium]